MLLIIQPKLNTQFLEEYNKLLNRMSKKVERTQNGNYEDEEVFDMMSIE